MSKITLILILLVIWLQYSFWYGKNNIFELLSIREFVKEQSFLNKKAEDRSRNNYLFAEIHDLYNGYEAIEERARSELFMIKVGEDFYRVVLES